MGSIEGATIGGRGAVYAVVIGTVMVDVGVETEADEEAAAVAAAAVAAATSKLQRMPACRHLVQEGLMRSHRRLKWRQRSQVLTSRRCGMSKSKSAARSRSE